MTEEKLLWEGERHGVATGTTMAKARYRITSQMIYFDVGRLSSQSEQVPLWAVRDIDVKQSMMQKGRGIGDLVVRVQHSDYTGRPFVKLDGIEKPHEVRDLLNQWSGWAREQHQQRLQTTHFRTYGPPNVPPPPQQAAPAAPTPADSQPPGSTPAGLPAAGASGQDMLDQLRQLGELKEAGVLNDDEFEEQKARLLGGPEAVGEPSRPEPEPQLDESAAPAAPPPSLDSLPPPPPDVQPPPSNQRGPF